MSNNEKQKNNPNNENYEKDSSELLNDVKTNLSKNVSEKVSDQDLADDLKNQMTVIKNEAEPQKENKNNENEINNTERVTVVDVTTNEVDNIRGVLEKEIVELPLDQDTEETKVSRGSPEFVNDFQSKLSTHVFEKISDLDLADDLKKQMTLNKNYESQNYDEKNGQKKKSIEGTSKKPSDDINETLKDSDRNKLLLIQDKDENRKPTTGNVSSEIESVKESSDLTNDMEKSFAKNISKTLSDDDLANSLKNRITVDKIHYIEPEVGDEESDRYEDNYDSEMTSKMSTRDVDDIHEILNDNLNRQSYSMDIGETSRKSKDLEDLESLTGNSGKEPVEEKTPEVTSVFGENSSETTLIKNYFDQIFGENLKNVKSSVKIEDVDEKREAKTEKEKEMNEDVKTKQQEVEKDNIVHDKIMLRNIEVDNKSKEKQTTEMDEAGKASETEKTKESSPIPGPENIKISTKSVDLKLPAINQEEKASQTKKTEEPILFSRTDYIEKTTKSEELKISARHQGEDTSEKEKPLESSPISRTEIIELTTTSKETTNSPTDERIITPETEETQEIIPFSKESIIERSTKSKETITSDIEQEIEESGQIRQDSSDFFISNVDQKENSEINKLLNDNVDRISFNFTESKNENDDQPSDNPLKDISKRSIDQIEKSLDNFGTEKDEKIIKPPNLEDDKKALNIEPKSTVRDQEEKVPEENLEEPITIPKTIRMEQKKENFNQLLDAIIDEELNKIESQEKEPTVDHQEEKPEVKKDITNVEEKQKSNVEQKITGEETGVDREDDKKSKTEIDREKESSNLNPKETSDASVKETLDENVNKNSDEKPKNTSDETYPANFCIQDDVRFLKFIANLNKIECTCNRAGNDFVLEDYGSDRHRKGCPSSLAPRDIESIKVIFLTKHLPICRRFLTANERQVLKNILKTAPYYQMEFFNRQNPYDIKCDGDDLVKDDMLAERTFPKRYDQKDTPPLKTKKAILDDLRDILNLGPSSLDPNLGRFPAEEYKFGEKYADKERKRPVDINDYPYEYPSTSAKPTNTDIADERLILNNLNDLEAWRCFTSICICDVIESSDDECCGAQTDPAEGHVRAVLMSRVPDDQQKATLAMVDRNLRYFDDLMKKRLREKIEQERVHMQMLKEGKLKKEALFVEILSYRSSAAKKTKREQELPALVNEMFRELIRNNKEIAGDLENKMRREEILMERDVMNQLRRRETRGELRLGSPNNEIFERYILDSLRDRICKANDLIRSELEYELDRSNETSLRLFQEVLNQMSQDRDREYENISQYFKSLYPTPDKTPSLSEQFDTTLSETMMPWTKSSSLSSEQVSLPEEKLKLPLQEILMHKDDKKKTESKTKYRKSSVTSHEDNMLDKVSYDSLNKKSLRPDAKYSTQKIFPERPEVRDARTQTSAQSSKVRSEMSAENSPQVRPEMSAEFTTKVTPKMSVEFTPKVKSAPLAKEIDKMMADLWNESPDKLALIRELANELRRYDLAEQSPKEKALSTKQSYKNFKEEIDSTIRRIPVRDRKRDVSPNRKGKNNKTGISTKRPDVPTTDNVNLLSDEEFCYFIIEMPMSDQRLDVFHDSFYGSRKTLAEITVRSEPRQIRTNIDMKN